MWIKYLPNQSYHVPVKDKLLFELRRGTVRCCGWLVGWVVSTPDIWYWCRGRVEFGGSVNPIIGS